MSMDATVLLISKNKEKLTELSTFITGIKGDEDFHFNMCIEDEFNYEHWSIVEFDARKIYLYEIHEKLTEGNKIDLFDDVYLVYWNDYNDSVELLVPNEECKSICIGDWWEKKFTIPEEYSNIPICDILKKRLS